MAPQSWTSALYRIDDPPMFPMTLFILISTVVIVAGAVLLLKDARSDPDAQPDLPRRPDAYR